MGALPKSKLGKWGFYLLIAFAALFLLAAIANVMFMPAIGIFAIGVVGAVLNTIALIKKDFSWLSVTVGSLIALFVILWVAGELLAPH